MAISASFGSRLRVIRYPCRKRARSDRLPNLISATFRQNFEPLRGIPRFEAGQALAGRCSTYHAAALQRWSRGNQTSAGLGRPPYDGRRYTVLVGSDLRLQRLCTYFYRCRFAGQQFRATAEKRTVRLLFGSAAPRFARQYLAEFLPPRENDFGEQAIYFPDRSRPTPAELLVGF